MAFKGRYQLGESIDLQLLCRDANNTPTVPTAAPQAKVWQGSTLVLNRLMPVLDRYNQTGLFHLPLFLGSLFSAGLYQVVFYYLVGSFNGVVSDNFEVLPGGHPDGNVISMYFLDRPQARYIVQKLDSGKIIQGRNPTL